MRIVKTIVGVLLILFGGWVVLLEGGMAISESHAIDGSTEIALIALFIIAGLGIALFGYLLLRTPPAMKPRDDATGDTHE